MGTSLTLYIRFLFTYYFGPFDAFPTLAYASNIAFFLLCFSMNLKNMQGSLVMSSEATSSPYSTQADAIIRLDKLLAQRLPHYSRTVLQTLISSGNVTVDGVIIIKPSKILTPA